jgi:hypothetical protein
MFSLASGAISREYLAGGFGKMSPTRAGKLTPNCVLEQTPQEPLADDLPGYTQAQRGTKSRALRISRSALR